MVNMCSVHPLQCPVVHHHETSAHIQRAGWSSHVVFSTLAKLQEVHLETGSVLKDRSVLCSADGGEDEEVEDLPEVLEVPSVRPGQETPAPPATHQHEHTSTPTMQHSRLSLYAPL